MLQIIGYITGIDSVRNIGRVSASSPLPIVFTEVKGVETFASDFHMQWTTENGTVESVQLTPNIYSKMKGPYNRRNIYGAAIAYGPVLPQPIWNSVLSYGLCNDILKDELELPVSKDNFSVVIKTRTTGRDDQWTLKTQCK